MFNYIESEIDKHQFILEELKERVRLLEHRLMDLENTLYKKFHEIEARGDSYVPQCHTLSGKPLTPVKKDSLMEYLEKSF